MTAIRKILADLVSVDTRNPFPGRNHPAIGDTIVSHLDSVCDTVEVIGVAADRPNVVAKIDGGSRPCIAFNRHVDVIPARPDNWDRPPLN